MPRRTSHTSTQGRQHARTPKKLTPNSPTSVIEFPISNRKTSSADSDARSYTSNALNQYSAITDPSVSPTYDEDGNMTFDGTWTYSWNGENRLSSATDGSTTITYVYDYMGRLVERDDGTDVARYVYDGWNRIATLQAGSVTSTNLWGRDLSFTLQGAGGVGGLLKEGTLYPLYDANGNIGQKLNSSGTTQMAVEYDPFGNIINGTLVGEYGFSTKPMDAETCLYYYGFRWYGSALGRWLSRDPLGSSGGVNIYGFIGNNCGNTYDLIGLQGITKTKCCGGKKVRIGGRKTCCGGRVVSVGPNAGCCGGSENGVYYNRNDKCCTNSGVVDRVPRWDRDGYADADSCAALEAADLASGDGDQLQYLAEQVIPAGGVVMDAIRLASCRKLVCPK